MNKSAVFLLLLSYFLGESTGFDKKKFLLNCRQRQGCYAECSTCSICENVNLSGKDYEAFKTQEFNILSNECIVFSKGDVGVVNGDFFKQFPSTRRMYFESVNLSLKSSEKVFPQQKLLFLMFLHSTLNDNVRTNALHSLVNLEKLEIIQSRLDSPGIDESLLEKNSKLRSFVMTDKNYAEPLDSVSLGKDLNLKYIKISKPLDGFPGELPKSTETFILENFSSTVLKNQHLKNLKEVIELKLSWGDIREIDENAFDDLEKLEVLDLEDNDISNFKTRHLVNNKGIRTLILDAYSGSLDLSTLGLRKGDKLGVFMKSI